MVEWLTLMLHIWEVLDPNLGPEIGYPDQWFLMVFLSSFRQMLGCAFKLGHEHFLPHPFQFNIYLSDDV
jgi:hypothetical protein